MSERELLILGVALYAGEGGKTDGEVRFANSDPRMICRVRRRGCADFFDVDEARLRMRLYLHDDLDLDAADQVLVRSSRRSRLSSSASRIEPCQTVDPTQPSRNGLPGGRRTAAATRIDV